MCERPAHRVGCSFLRCRHAAHSLAACCLRQIDLSDDLVALMMFADGEWEKQMAAVEYQDEEGKTKQLQLQEQEFREVSRGVIVNGSQ